MKCVTFPKERGRVAQSVDTLYCTSVSFSKHLTALRHHTPAAYVSLTPHPNVIPDAICQIAEGLSRYPAFANVANMFPEHIIGMTASPKTVDFDKLSHKVILHHVLLQGLSNSSMRVPRRVIAKVHNCPTRMSEVRTI